MRTHASHVSPAAYKNTRTLTSEKLDGRKTGPLVRAAQKKRRSGACKIGEAETKGCFNT